MIETAIDVTDGKVPTAILKDLIDLGRDMAAHPIEILPDVRETLEAVAERYRILLITKGDLLDQEQKLARSRSEEHTSELQSQSNLVCRLLLEKKKKHSPQQRLR